MIRNGWWMALGIAVAGSSLSAQSPPRLVSYQGVLRDAADAPLGGAFDMRFRFFDAATGGNELLVDAHTAAGGSAVIVSGGLFAVELGGGTLSDGTGPGTYANLDDVFGANGTVYLELQIGAETLAPRSRIVSAPFALNAERLDGRPAAGFLDTTATFQQKSGRLRLSQGIYGSPVLDVWGGDYAAKFQNNWLGPGTALLARERTGIEAYGSDRGGYFWDSDQTGKAWLADGDYAFLAEGTLGARISNPTDPNNNYVELVGPTGYGIWALGIQGGVVGLGTGGSGLLGGRFEGLRGESYGGFSAGNFVNYSDNYTWATLAGVGRGVEAQGLEYGGHFTSGWDGDAEVWLAGDDTPPQLFSSTTWGIYALGGYSAFEANGGAGFFRDTTFSGYAKVGHEHYGIQGFGNSAGGYFKDIDHSGTAFVASGDRGIWGMGTFAGGTFSHPDTVSHWADVSTPTRKIVGTGTVSFVQNHPYDAGKVIVYAAPEGDEVATYTRGTARLIGGEARVVLGETFAWVTNPDLGLTAHLTPRGEPVALAVESLSTDELIVRGPHDADVAFDYLVYGLRIGFEESAVVRRKEREAPLPAAAEIARESDGVEELRSAVAFERFRSMELAAGRGSEGSPRAAGAAALRAAIDQAGAGSVGRRESTDPVMTSTGEERASREVDETHVPASGRAGERPPGPPLPGDAGVLQRAGAPGAVHRDVAPLRQVEPGRLVAAMPAAGRIEAGDLMVADATVAGTVRAVASPADPAVIGIALAAPDDGSVPVVVGGVTTCNADASWGAILPGDLLVTSPTPGHAMRAASPVAGTVVAKALEPLASGSGPIRVLVMPR